MNWIALEAKTKEAGLTNEEVAKKLSINQATYYRKKRGFSDFYREEIRIITDLLNLSPEDVNYIFLPINLRKRKKRGGSCMDLFVKDGNQIYKVNYICMCNECRKRGMPELELVDQEGNYVDYIKMSDLFNGKYELFQKNK